MTGPHGAPASEPTDGRFLGVARRYSLCDDDAWEALARGLEIALRHRHTIRRASAAAWFATVVKHEALHVRGSRTRELHLDPAAYEAPAPEPEPQHEPDRRLPALRAAMRQLTPDQRCALTIFYAMDPGGRDGGRYRRIMDATGWSYTKVNRCLSEGRA